ncbi:MAG: HEAT repeat domain-containing protein [Nitrospirota bacterium]
MDEPKTDDDALPIAPAKEPANPELASVKRLLALLDKTAKSSRTYGSANPVAQKFFQQLFEGLTAHLATYSKLAFLVQRSELYFNGEAVYQSDQDSSNESVAFKLYSDGIRELTFLEGLPAEDLSYLLDSFWGSLDPDEDDDDIVTRLWSKNLSTIMIVTAEEIVKFPGKDPFAAPTAEAMAAPESSLRELLDQEQAKAKKGKALGADGSNPAAGSAASRFKSGLVGYEVLEEDLAALAKEIQAESSRDNTTYVLDMLTAILASEKSPTVLSKLLSLWGSIVESLTAQGEWSVLNNILELLCTAPEIRPDFSDDHKKQLAALLDDLARPDRLKLIETYLNKLPDSTTEGLLAVLLSMTPAAVPVLCTLLANLEAPAHQKVVIAALETLARDQLDPLLRGLSDRRPRYVKNLLAILLKWNDPRIADAVEKLARYPDAQIRKEVVRAIGIFRPNGNGTKLLSFLNDSETPTRLAALKLLMTGQYQVPYSSWSALVSDDSFLARPHSEKRALFQAMRATSGDEVLPFFENLFTEWSWTNRKKREDLAILAAEALGKLPGPAALTALELGQKKGNAAIRQACASAIALAQRQQQLKQAAS